MTAIAPTLQSFFTDHLRHQRHASGHTVAAYRDSWKLLLGFAQQTTGKSPSQIHFADLDAPLVGAFLDYLEHQRGNGARTRNARLASIHSLFRYAALRHPEDAAVFARVLAVPPKRFNHNVITYLSREEIAALLAAPNQTTWTGRRDHAMLALAAQTGLRVSEFTGLTVADLHLGVGPHVSCHGKGRKQRITPLTPATVGVLGAWLVERAASPSEPLFPTRRGTALTRDAVERRLALYTSAAAARCASLAGKKVTPHVLRHSAAMSLLAAGVDTTVIALWLGHENVATTQIYIHADLALKQQAIARTAPHDVKPGRYQPPDQTLAFLESL
jgi:site-specific recombinase XerD